MPSAVVDVTVANTYVGSNNIQTADNLLTIQSVPFVLPLLLLRRTHPNETVVEAESDFFLLLLFLEFFRVIVLVFVYTPIWSTVVPLILYYR